MASWSYLSLPKKPISDQIPIRPLGQNVPKGAIPVLSRLPYDAKLPLPHCTEYDFVLSYTKLGQSRYQTFTGKDFETTDPYNKVHPPIEYNALNDPNLKQFFKTSTRFKKLVREGKVSHDGRVMCSLSEYNKYRLYLHKLWGIEINRICKTQLREERIRMESRLAEKNIQNESIIAKDYEKELIEWERGLLKCEGKLAKEGQSKAEEAFRSRSTFFSAGEKRWNAYLRQLQETYGENYEAVWEWLMQSTQCYRSITQKRLETHKKKQQMLQERYVKLKESSLKFVEEQLAITHREKELKRKRSARIEELFKKEWEANEKQLMEKARRRRNRTRREGKLVQKLIDEFQEKKSMIVCHEEFRGVWTAKDTIESTIAMLRGQSPELFFEMDVQQSKKEKSVRFKGTSEPPKIKMPKPKLPSSKKPQKDKVEKKKSDEEKTSSEEKSILSSNDTSTEKSSEETKSLDRLDLTVGEKSETESVAQSTPDAAEKEYTDFSSSDTDEPLSEVIDDTSKLDNEVTDSDVSSSQPRPSPDQQQESEDVSKEILEQEDSKL